MRKRKIKKVLLISFSVLVFLFIVLCAHIYIMMKPRPADSKTIAMARIDFKQDIKQSDADKITSWLYSQQGVQHVLCNQKTDIAVFTFYPAKISADKLVSNLSSSLNYKAIRYTPTKEEMMRPKPMMTRIRWP